MNELEFKRHIKDLVHGRHHPEEHDWKEPGAKRSSASGVKRLLQKRTRKRVPKRG